MNIFCIIKKYLKQILIICIIVESIFFFSIPNILGCIVFLYGLWLFNRYIFKKENYINFFIPTIVIKGYLMMYYFVPIIVTLLEYKPVTFNFEEPITLWLNQIINVTVIVMAYNWSKKCNQNNFLQKIWLKLGYFKSPNTKELWILGILGLLALIYLVQTQTSIDDYEDVQKGAKGGFIFSVIQNVQVLSLAPLFLFFSKYYAINRIVYNKRVIISYIIVILLFSIATTKRSLIIYPIISFLVLYLIDAIINNKRVISAKKLFCIISGIFILGGPLTDLALAMSLNRHNINGSNTFENVINLYQNKEKLQMMKQSLSFFMGQDVKDNSQGWSEYYVDNIFLDRFCNLRVQDATIFYAKELGYNNKEMHQFAKDFVMFRLPSFVTNILGEKKVVLTSPADKIYEHYFNVRNFVGQKVGGDIGIGLYWLGYLYYPIALVIYFVTFYFMGSLTYIKNAKIIIPIPILCSLSSYFLYLINSQGIFRSINLIMRSGIQGIIVYCLIFFIIRKMVRL